MGSKIAELLDADKIVSRADEGFEGVIKRAGETGERGEEAIRLLNRLGKALTEAGEKTAEFSGRAEAETLGLAFESAKREANFQKLAKEIGKYNDLIQNTKLDAVNSKISGLPDAAAREALSKDEAFIDAFINSEGRGTNINFTELNKSNLFGDLNGNKFVEELNKPESGLGQLIGKEDAAERVEEYNAKRAAKEYENIVGNPKSNEFLKEVFVDSKNKYGELYKNDEFISSLEKTSKMNPTELEDFITKCKMLSDESEIESFSKKINEGKSFKEAFEAVERERGWRGWGDSLTKRLTKRNVLGVGGVLGGVFITGLAFKKAGESDNRDCNINGSEDPKICKQCCDGKSGKFKEGALDNATKNPILRGIKSIFTDVPKPKAKTDFLPKGAASPIDCSVCDSGPKGEEGSQCAFLMNVIKTVDPPEPLLNDQNKYVFDYSNLGYHIDGEFNNWPKNCNVRENGEEGDTDNKNCWMDKEFKTFTGEWNGGPSPPEYKYPDDKNYRWSSGFKKYNSCGSCLGDWDGITDITWMSNMAKCNISNGINKVINWLTCVGNWLIIFLICCCVVYCIWDIYNLFSGKKTIIYISLLPIIIAFFIFSFAILSISWNFLNGKTDCSKLTTEELQNRLTDVIEGKYYSLDIINFIINLITNPLYVIVIEIVWTLLAFYILGGTKKVSKDPLANKYNWEPPPMVQEGGSRKNKAFDVIKNINRYTKGLIILSLIVAILITYFYKKNKENTIKKQYLNEIKKERSSRIENIKQMREKEKRDKEERAKQEAKQEANQGPFKPNNVFGGQFI